MIPKVVICLQLVALTCLVGAIFARADDGKVPPTGAAAAADEEDDLSVAHGNPPLVGLAVGKNNYDHDGHDHHDDYDSSDTDDESDDDSSPKNSQPDEIQLALERVYGRLFNKDVALSAAEARKLLEQADQWHSQKLECDSWCRMRRSEHSKFRRLIKVIKSDQPDCEPGPFEDTFSWLQEQEEYLSLSDLLRDFKTTRIKYCIDQLRQVAAGFEEQAKFDDSFLDPVKQTLEAKIAPVERFWRPPHSNLSEAELRDAVVDVLVANSNDLKRYEADVEKLQDLLYNRYFNGLLQPCKPINENAQLLVTNYDAIAEFNVGKNQFVDVLRQEYDQFRRFIEDCRLCVAIKAHTGIKHVLYKYYLARLYNVEQIWQNLKQPGAAPVEPEELLKQIRILTQISTLDASNMDIQRKSNQLSSYIVSQSNSRKCKLDAMIEALKNKLLDWNDNVHGMFVYYASQSFDECSQIVARQSKELLERWYVNLGQKEIDPSLHELEVLRLTLIDTLSGNFNDADGQLTRAVAKYLNHKGLVADILKNKNPQAKARKLIEQRFEKICPLINRDHRELIASLTQLQRLQDLGVDRQLAPELDNLLLKYDICQDLINSGDQNTVPDYEKLIDILNEDVQSGSVLVPKRRQSTISRLISFGKSRYSE